MKSRSNFYRNHVFSTLDYAESIIVLDVETTGLQADAQIIQFSGIRYRICKTHGFRLVEDTRLNRYIRPEKPLPKKIIEVTGLTDDFLASYPVEKDIFPEIKKFLAIDAVICGYNVEFDLGKINGLYTRMNDSITFSKVIDVLEMARDCISKENIKNYKLCTVASYFKVDSGITFHSSMDDSIVTARCFIQLLGRYLEAWKQEKNLSKEKMTLSYCYYWENPYQKSMQRLIAVTTVGDIYFDVIKKQWGISNRINNLLAIEEIDLDFLEKQCFSKYHCSSLEELILHVKSL